jgi:hypothetical protein
MEEKHSSKISILKYMLVKTTGSISERHNKRLNNSEWKQFRL